MTAVSFYFGTSLMTSFLLAVFALFLNVRLDSVQPFVHAMCHVWLTKHVTKFVPLLVSILSWTYEVH